MRSTFKILFYIDKRVVKLKEDGTTAVMCRISIDGKTSSMSTGEYCVPSTWNAKNESKKLQYFRKSIEECYNHLLSRHKVVSAELIKNTLNGVNTPSGYILEAGEVERERLRLRAIEINSNSTYRQSKTTHKNLRDFILSRGSDDILFTDITEEFAESFKLFLKGVLGYKANHINHCMCWLNRLIYIAVDNEILRANPIEDVKYEKKDPPKLKHITKSELKRIMETPMLDYKMELARRMFIFSSYTGLAYVDLRGLYPYHIEKTSDGRGYIRASRIKTKVEAFVPLHPIAEQILSLYNTTDNNQPVFPLPIRDVLWFDVHSLGVAMGIKENLSHHCARHTYAVLLISAGIPIESITKMMGHTNISTTQVYARVTDQKISEDMDRLMERRKKMNSNN